MQVVSKKMESSAMVGRLQHVGSVLDQTEEKAVRARIDSWLDANKSVHKRLLSFLESGMVHDMLSGETQKRLPRSCVRLKLLSAAIRNKSIATLNACLGTSALRQAKAKDSKSIDKLMMIASGLPPSFPMRGGLHVAEWLQLWQQRADIYGKRLERIAISGDGVIDWNVHGVYAFASVSSRIATGGAAYDELVGADARQATHVAHKAAQVKVTLKSKRVGLSRIIGSRKQR